MCIEENVFICFANEYHFTTDDGKDLSGCSVYYLNSDTLSPVNNEDGESKGYRFVKSTLPFGSLAQLPYVPGFYKGQFEPGADAKGNLVLRLTNAIPITSVKLESNAIPEKKNSK